MKEPSIIRLLFRMLVPTVVVFLLSFFAMGFVAGTSEIRSLDQKASPFIPSFELPDDALAMAFARVRQGIVLARSIPPACLAENAASEFQAKQCDDFWGQFSVSIGLALAPIVIPILFLFFLIDSVRAYFKKIQKKMKQGKALFSGVVTEPALAPGDKFSWFYCLRPIMVQLPDKAQVKVYFPLDAPIPNPGDTVAVFDGGFVLGAKRYAGVFYAPHVVVIGSGG